MAKQKPAAPPIESQLLRKAPQSIESEQAILGGIMIAPDALDVAAEIISEEDFFRRDHRAIWRAINQLAAKGQPFDAVTMGEWFQANGFAELVGGASYVIELSNATPSARRVRDYALIVKSKARLRAIIDIGSEVAGMAFEANASEDIMDAAITRMMALQRVDVGAEFTLGQAMRKAQRNMLDIVGRGGKISGVPTGLDDVDKSLGGLHNSDLIVIGARPSMGKTALLVNWSQAAARAGCPNGVISGEQPADQWGARSAALGADVSAEGFRTGDFDDESAARLFATIDRDEDLPVWILDRSAPHIHEVQRVARRWKHRFNIRALYVDYIQRMEAPGSERKDVVSNVVRGLKTLARELCIPVVALSQVKREVEMRANKIPRMGDLADSSEIEKEADVIAMLFRECVYSRTEANARKASLVIEKNRHGRIGSIPLDFDEETMRFANGVRQEALPINDADKPFSEKYGGHRG